MEQFDTVEMASGGLALVLEARSSWEEFSSYLKKWVAQLNAKQISEPVINVDECLAEVEILDGRFWITYDDFQGGIQLEPMEDSFNIIVIKLQKELRGDL